LAARKILTLRLNKLIELDFDAIEAYEAAIVRLSDASDAEQLRLYMGDHEEHTRNLADLVIGLGGIAATKADFKRVLTKGKVVIAGLGGNNAAVLKAMKSNEDDTNRAYERALSQEGLPSYVVDVLQKNLADERRHRTWMEERIRLYEEKGPGASAHPPAI
jgi:uncharacterized protein (TIGR02284 family)